MLRFGSICLSLALVLSSTGNAHHGIIGQFDLATTFTLDGRVTDIDFVNPHSYVYFDVADADGNTESWNCELRGATALRRSGWNKEMFATGTRVSIHGSPDWREANTCYVLEIDFPAEDLSLQRYQQLETTAVETTRAARTSWGAPNIGGDWAAPQFLPLEEEEAGILKPLDPNEPMNIDSFFREGGVLQAQGILNGQLTEQGEQMAAAFDRVSAPLYRCEAMNVLPDLIFDWYINQIVQTEDRIEILYGNSGQWRTIRLDEQDFPESIEPSRFGYSIGTWDDDVLIVQTRGFLPGILHAIVIPELAEALPPGVIMHSAELQIEERFTLDLENFALRREYSATDPVAFTGSYDGNDVMYPSNVGYVEGECDPETSRAPNGTRVIQ